MLAKASPRRSKLTESIRERVAARLLAGEGQQDIADAINATLPTGQRISVQIVKTVQAEMSAGLLAPDVSGFSPTKQQQLERAVRAERVALRAEIEAEVRAELTRFYDDVFIPGVNAKHDRAEQIIAAHAGLMTRANFRKLLSVLHPDSTTDVERKPRLAEVFQIVKDLEGVLVKDDPAPVKGTGMPATLAEWMARRKPMRRR